MKGLLVAVACVALGAPLAFAQGQPAPTGPTPASAAAPGMTIHIDPQTGTILEGPAPGSVPLQMTPELQNALSTSHQGLVEAPSSVPGGGVIVDLQGRFQSPLVGTIDPSGKLKIQHLHRPHAGGGDSKEVSPRSTDR